MNSVTEPTIRDLAAHQDQDIDGISGHPNKVWDVQKQGLKMGGFGWKELEIIAFILEAIFANKNNHKVIIYLASLIDNFKIGIDLQTQNDSEVGSKITESIDN